MAKKITAPKTHKPKGSAKERLAYLNKGEMKALVKRKGSPARRGPKGIPSFAEDSASSKGVSRGDSSGTRGSGSTQTATGSVSNASTGSRGAGSNYGAGSGQPSSGGGFKGGDGGMRGAGSNYGPGSGRPNSGRASTPASPMSGQGASYGGSWRAAQANRDYIRDNNLANKVSRFGTSFPRESVEDVRGVKFPGQEAAQYYQSEMEKLDKRVNDLVNDSRRFSAGLSAGRTRNAGEYNARVLNEMRDMENQFAREDEAARRSESIQNENLDRSQMPMRDSAAIARGVGVTTPNIRVGNNLGAGGRGGFNRGGMGQTRFKAGGLVKKASDKSRLSKTTKKK